MATRNIVPRADGEGGIGTSAKAWLKGFFKSIRLITGAAANSILTGDANGDAYWGLTYDTDGALTGNSDAKIATQKATKTYADLKLAKASNLSDVASAATAFGNIKQSATTSATGVVELATQAEVLAGTDTSRAVVPVDLHAKVAISKNPLAFAQGIAMTYAATGSTGIQVANNVNINPGTGSFGLIWKGALPNYKPSTTVRFFYKYADINNRLSFHINTTTGYLEYLHRVTGGTSVTAATTSAPNIVDGTEHEFAAVITRETASTAGSVAFYIDGVLFQTIAIPQGTPADLDGITSNLYVSGEPTKRHDTITNHVYIFNRALTAAEVLSLYQNGIAEADKWGSQTALTSGTLTVGKKYRIDTYVSDDDFTNVGATSNASGVEFTATGTTPTKWTNSSSLVQIGATLDLEPEGIQPAPGQWLDSSTNKLHAWQPSAGSSLTRYQNKFEIRGINTWSGTHEAQSIAWPTDASKPILPAGCYIDSIIGVITGTTIEDIIIGDGSDTDRWVAATTGLAAGTVSFTIANHISDGTNYEMVVDPDANFTGSIEWTIRGTILD